MSRRQIKPVVNQSKDKSAQPTDQKPGQPGEIIGAIACGESPAPRCGADGDDERNKQYHATQTGHLALVSPAPAGPVYDTQPAPQATGEGVRTYARAADMQRIREY